MINNIIHPFLFQAHCDFGTNRFGLTYVVKFGVNIPCTAVEINRKIAWKFENVVTTQNKTMNNILSMILYHYL